MRRRVQVFFNPNLFSVFTPSNESVFLQLFKSNKEERYSRVPRLSDTRYSAKGTKGKWWYSSGRQI